MTRKVTIRDVAYLAGVSISTVSRVVSNKVNVNEATRQKVQRAIDKTGYEPNYTARALATKNTDTIAVIIDRTPSKGFGNSFFLDILDAIATRLNFYSKDMLLVFSDGKNSTEYSKVKSLIQSNKIDGVIKLSVQKNDKTIEYLKESGKPTVVVGRPDSKNILSVNNDNSKAMQNAVNFLIKKGAKKTAFVGGNKEYIVTIDRQEGFETALKKHMIKYTHKDIFYTDFSIDAGYEIADKLIEKNYDSVACTDDLIAYGIAKRYNELGRFIKIISFNNTYLSKISNLPFSSVDINAKLLGKEAVDLMMNPEYSKKHTLVDTKLIVRS
ncbi:LacI family DNA-binding transcriptional regulator [Helcococcus bovis]|uniref:LacI family DNA-binding transcriptional regulator n=1 Tax=Helcococcus bovis TaxID=3153252 RepID=UPI0038BA2F7A